MKPVKDDLDSRAGAARRPAGRRACVCAVLLAAGLAAAAAAPASQAEDFKPSFRSTSLRVGGKVDRRVVYDFDGDGLQDLALFRGRLLLLFLQKKGEGFGRWPDQAFTVWRNAVMCDFARLRRSPGVSLVMASESGVFFHRFEGRGFSKEAVPLVEVRTALGYPGESDLHCRKFVFDVDGDGSDEIVVPVEKAYAVFRQDEAGALSRMATLPCAPRVTGRHPGAGVLGDLSLTAKYPVPVCGDWDGDGKADFVVRNHGNLWVYLQRGKGMFLSNPDTAVDTSFKQPSGKKSGRLSFGFETPVMIADLNGDGILDLVKHMSTEGMTTVFLRKKGLKGLDDPSLVVRVDGWPLGSFSPDLDGDGMPDLVVGHVNKIGVLGAIKIFLTKSVSIHAAFFMNRKGFSAEPDRTMTVDASLRFATTAEGFRLGTTALVNFDGDFDGDGRRDLLVKTGFMRLEIYRGEEEGVFDRKPFAAVEIPDSEACMWAFPEVVDLNRDGVSDILVHYRDWEEKMDAVHLLLSTGGRPR